MYFQITLPVQARQFSNTLSTVGTTGTPPGLSMMTRSGPLCSTRAYSYHALKSVRQCVLPEVKRTIGFG